MSISIWAIRYHGYETGTHFTFLQSHCVPYPLVQYLIYLNVVSRMPEWLHLLSLRATSTDCEYTHLSLWQCV